MMWQIIVLITACLVAYLLGNDVGYKEGLVKYGWCGSCESYHGNDQQCQELPEWK